MFGGSPAGVGFGGGHNAAIGGIVPWNVAGGSENDLPADERFYYFEDAGHTNIVLRPGLYIIAASVRSHGLWTPAVEPGDDQFWAGSELDLADAFTGGGGGF